MDSRIYIYLLFLFAYFILSHNGESKRNVNKFAKFCCFLLFLEAGLRHANVGPDTPTYYMSFLELKTESLSNLLNRYYETYVLGVARDPSYSLIVKLFTTITDSWQMFLLFAAGVYFCALYKFLTRYVETLQGMLLAFTFCISLFHIIPLSGMRQQFTMAIAMLLPPLIEGKRMLPFLAVVLVGTTIHSSLSFVLPLYFLYHYLIGNSKKVIVLAFLCIPIIAYGAKSILGVLVSFIKNDYYAGYLTDEKSGAFLYIVFFSLIVFIAIYYYDKVALKTPKIFCSALIMISLTVPLIVVDGAMIRIGQYFTIYSMLFLPYIIHHTNNKVLYYGLLVVLLFLAFKESFEYHFFWENLDLNFQYK